MTRKQLIRTVPLVHRRSLLQEELGSELVYVRGKTSLRANVVLAIFFAMVAAETVDAFSRERWYLVVIGCFFIIVMIRMGWQLLNRANSLICVICEKGIYINTEGRPAIVRWPDVRRWTWSQSPKLQLNLFEELMTHNIQIPERYHQDVESLLTRHVGIRNPSEI